MSAAFDPAVLDVLVSQIGPDVTVQAVGLFLDQVPSRSEALRTSLAAQDWSAAAGIAHQLRSSGASLGALLLAERGAEVENAIRSQDLDGVPEGVQTVIDELGRAGDALARWHYLQTSSR